jgi:hypothetical protein
MSANGGYGDLNPTTATSEFNAVAFQIRQFMATVRIMTPVVVKAVHVDGEVAAVGTVDVQPLVSMVDGVNNATPHGTLYGIPFFRLQGGARAIVVDPAVDDVGYMIVSDRDMSSVVASKKVSPPGSGRRWSLSDGVYVGGILNATPTDYVLISDSKIRMQDRRGNVVLMDANGVTITPATGKPIILNGPVVFNGVVSGQAGGGGTVNFGSANLLTTGGVTSATATIGGKAFATHEHSGVQGGSGNTGPVV